MIVFGPWVGEFGWELARWVPACRHIANKYPKERKYAIGPVGHGILYEFVDEYIEFDANFEYVSCMTDARYEDKKHEKKWSHYVNMANTLGGRRIDSSIVGAQRPFKTEPRLYKGTKTDFIKSIIGDKRSICVFPRQRTHEKHRNWPIKKWIKVIEHYCDKGFHVLAFGGPEDRKIPFKHPSFTDFIEYRANDELDIAVSALNLSDAGVAIQSGGIYISMYSCKLTVAFGIPLHAGRLKSKNITNSCYHYVTTKNYAFDSDFIIRNVSSYL